MVDGENRKGMVDMRKRFRGNQPIAVSTELEAGAGPGEDGERRQLYGGRPAIGKTVGTTDGEGEEP